MAPVVVPSDEAVLSDPLSEDNDVAAVDPPGASADMKVWRSPKSFETRSVPGLDDTLLDAAVLDWVVLASAVVDVADDVVSDVPSVVLEAEEPP